MNNIVTRSVVIDRNSKLVIDKHSEGANSGGCVQEHKEAVMAPRRCFAAVVTEKRDSVYANVQYREVTIRGNKYVDCSDIEPLPVIDFDISSDDDDEAIKKKRTIHKRRLNKRKRDAAIPQYVKDEDMAILDAAIAQMKQASEVAVADRAIDMQHSRYSNLDTYISTPYGFSDDIGGYIKAAIDDFGVNRTTMFDAAMGLIHTVSDLSYFRECIEKYQVKNLTDKRYSRSTKLLLREKYALLKQYSTFKFDELEAAIILSNQLYGEPVMTQSGYVIPERQKTADTIKQPLNHAERMHFDYLIYNTRLSIMEMYKCPFCPDRLCTCEDNRDRLRADILAGNAFTSEMHAKYGIWIKAQGGEELPERNYTGLYPNPDWWGSVEPEEESGDPDDDSTSTFGTRMNKVYSYGTQSLTSLNSFKDMLSDIMDSLEDTADIHSIKYVKCLEDIALFYFLDVPRLNSKTEAIFCFYRLAKSITGFSICDKMFGWLNNIIKSINNSCDVTTQSGESFIDESYFSKFLKGSAFGHLQKLVCALSTIAISHMFFETKSTTGVGETSDRSRNVFEILWQNFKPMLKKRLKWDIVTTVFEFCKWAANRGLEILRGDTTFASVFFEQGVAQCFDERLAGLDYLHDSIETGNDSSANLEKYMFDILELETICRNEFEKAENKVMRVTLQRQLTLILRHKTDMLRMLESEANRPAPFAVLLSGTTSVGKTVLTSLIIPQLQRAMGVKQGPQYVFNFDTNDKFMSGMTYDKNTITLDDLANTDLNFTEKVASDFVIYLINNYRRYAIKADVESKGKIPLRPAIVVGSTNIPDLNSKSTSVEPLSILRRFEYHIDVKVKDRCGEGPDGKKMIKKLDHNPADHGFDCWVLSFSRYIPHHGAEKYQQDPVPDMQNVSLEKAMKFLVAEAKEFKIKQDKLVARLKNMHNDVYCEHDIFEYLCSTCSRNEAEAAVESLPMHLQIATMGGNEFTRKASWHIGHQADRFGAWCKANSVQPPVEKKDKAAFSMMRVSKFLMSINIWQRRKLAWYQTLLMGIAGVLLAPLTSWGLSAYALAWPICMAGIYTVSTGVRIARLMNVTAYSTMVGAIQHVRKDWKKSLRSLVPLGVVIGMSYAGYKAWKYYNDSKITSQGCKVSLPIPSGVSGRKDPYRPPQLSVPCVNLDAKTSTPAQISTAIEQKLVLMKFAKDSVQKTEHCVSMPLCTGYWFIPMHMLLKGYDSVEIIRHHTIHSNSTRKARLAGCWRRVGITDYALAYLPTMGDQRDFRKFFPSGDKLDLKGVGARCVWLRGTVEVLSDNDKFISLSRGQTKVNLKTEYIKPHNLEFGYEGGIYEFPDNTWEGMCGSVLLSDVNGPTIVGLHSAGAAGTTHARSCTIMRKDIDECIEHMTQKETCQLLGVQSGDFSSSLDYKGTNFEFIPTVRPKATSLFVDSGSFDCLGSSTAPHRTFRSRVKPTLIADTVCKIFDISVKHGAPKYINHWGPWNTWVTAMSNPSDIPCDILDKAYLDYRDHIFAGWRDDWCERIHPLAEDAVLSGIDGLQGCYAMNYKASMGIPYCKPKGDFIKPSERVVENISYPRDMPEHLRKEIEEMEQKLSEGYRVYSPHRCCLKDEPVKLVKDKVRVFMGSQFAYQYLMRKYFLMISIIMQENPELFECAVGVKASSKEWTRLHKHIFKYSKKNCIAGDYAKYDQKMDVKVVLAAFKILLAICAKAGYSEYQLAVCNGLAIETCMAIYDVRNEWMQFNCGVSSGNPLTVVLNSLCNSILKRCAKIALQPLAYAEVPFADIVALMTYGDDNVMSVDENVSWFTHTAVAQVLKEWGMDYTMADKEAESVPYITSDKIEFLKRMWVWSDEYQQYLCPLAESSIHKALTCALHSDVLSLEQHSAEIIAGANLEYFFYGRDIFEKRHAQLCAVLKECDIAHHVPGGKLKNYQELEDWYLEK